MPTETYKLNIPDSLAREINTANQDLLVELLERGLHSLKIERALDRYSRGGISFGAAAQEAGVSQAELARHAYARDMEPPFSEETMAEELS